MSEAFPSVEELAEQVVAAFASGDRFHERAPKLIELVQQIIAENQYPVRDSFADQVWEAAQ